MVRKERQAAAADDNSASGMRFDDSVSASDAAGSFMLNLPIKSNYLDSQFKSSVLVSQAIVEGDDETSTLQTDTEFQSSAA